MLVWPWPKILFFDVWPLDVCEDETMCLKLLFTDNSKMQEVAFCRNLSPAFLAYRRKNVAF